MMQSPRNKKVPLQVERHVLPVTDFQTINMFYKSALVKSLFCLFLTFQPAICFSQQHKKPSGTITRIDSLFSQFNNANSPGYAVGVFKDQKILLAKGYGIANLEHNIPITANTVFNIASLSKQITAACIALLILRDSISLEDEVSKYIPGVAKYNTPVRIKHLVYFTSGIHEYHTLPRKNGLNWNMLDYFTIDTAIAASLAQPLDFEPGTRWAYSNTDYMLLAKIVEKVSGRKLNEFAQENVFIPLAMKSTQINDDVTAIVKDRATGYELRSEETVNATRKAGFYLRKEGEYLQVHRNSPHYGGSGVFTSINDWYLWDRNFYTRQMGGFPFNNLMHLRMQFGHDKKNDAFGLVFGDYKGEEMIWYAGGDIGFNSYVMRFPGQSLTIVCFSNLGIGGNAEKMAKHVADVLIADHVLKVKNKK
jgi:CubicO group peptidase (beta-lactamase class C family)